MVLIVVPHDSPYPPSDRHVSFTEMIYHLGLVRQDIRDIKALITQQREDDASEVEGRRRSWRWAAGIAVAAATSAADLIIQVT